MKPRTQSPPFSLLDALGLIAATALGLALTRSISGIDGMGSMDFINFQTPPGGRNVMNTSLPFRAYEPGPRVFPRLTDWVQRGLFWACPLLSAWTLALVPLTLLRAPESRGRFLRQPGPIAAMAWFVGFVIVASGFAQALIGGVHSAEGPTLHWRHWWAATCLALPKASFIAVVASWLTLALIGGWKADRGWLDRLGRAVAWAWLILGSLRIASSWLAVFYT